jgi:hypothetical protein
VEEERTAVGVLLQGDEGDGTLSRPRGLRGPPEVREGEAEGGEPLRVVGRGAELLLERPPGLPGESAGPGLVAGPRGGAREAQAPRPAVPVERGGREVEKGPELPSSKSQPRSW